MVAPILVCSDRDGTANEDNNYYLGRSPNWKDQVKLLPGFVDGTKALKTNPNVWDFLVTNQAGVALGYFDERRMHEVNNFIMNLARAQGADIDGYFACPFVDKKYAEEAARKGRTVNPRYIVERHRDLKPNVGMLKRAALLTGHSLSECKLYVPGDRFTDVQMGLAGGGKGILIASGKTRELGDVEKVEELSRNNPGRVYIATDFLDAAKWIIKDFS